MVKAQSSIPLLTVGGSLTSTDVEELISCLSDGNVELSVPLPREAQTRTLVATKKPKTQNKEQLFCMLGCGYTTTMTITKKNKTRSTRNPEINEGVYVFFFLPFEKCKLPFLSILLF